MGDRLSILTPEYAAYSLESIENSDLLPGSYLDADRGQSLVPDHNVLASPCRRPWRLGVIAGLAVSESGRGHAAHAITLHACDVIGSRSKFPTEMLLRH